MLRLHIEMSEHSTLLYKLTSDSQGDTKEGNSHFQRTKETQGNCSFSVQELFENLGVYSTQPL